MSPESPGRLPSIDIVRGAILFLMALDHVRIYFSDAQFSAVDPERTHLLLFLIRWVTHYCAPGFYLLAGMSIWLYCNSLRDRREASLFLLTRGAWLILLELTIVGLAWSFNPGWSWLGVIWSLGWSFILMALLVHVPIRPLFWTSAAVVFVHAVPGDWYFDGLTGPPGPVATVLYVSGPVELPLLGQKGVLYSIFPWAAMMSMGFALGPWFTESVAMRRNRFLRAGLGMVLLFIVLRVTNFYGNPAQIWAGWSGEFAVGDSLPRTFINLLNTDKYPPSPQFALMTFGPLFIALGLLASGDARNRTSSATRVLRLTGQAPMFFYVTHLYLIHGLALFTAIVAGKDTTILFWDGVYPQLRPPDGYGYGDWTVLAIWLAICAVLYGLCRQYRRLESTRPCRWLRYI